MLVIGFDRIEFASQTDVGVRRSHNQDAHASHLAGPTIRNGEELRPRIPGSRREWMLTLSVNWPANWRGWHNPPYLPKACFTSWRAGRLRKAFIEANATIHAKAPAESRIRRHGNDHDRARAASGGGLDWPRRRQPGVSRSRRPDRADELRSQLRSGKWLGVRGLNLRASRGFPATSSFALWGQSLLVQVDIEGPHELEAGDIFLLCSDGLSGQVSDAEMGRSRKLSSARRSLSLFGRSRQTRAAARTTSPVILPSESPMVCRRSRATCPRRGNHIGSSPGPF